MLVDNTLLLFFTISKHFTFAAIYKWGRLVTFYEMCFMCFYVTCAFQQRWGVVCGSSFWCRWRHTNNVLINFHVWLYISSYKSSDKIPVNTSGAEMNVCFRCCWGCWQALRSSFPHAAAASTLRSPTTSCRWQAVRSGQNSLQQTEKLHTIIKITIGNQFSDSYVTTWFFFLPLFDWCKVKQSVSSLWFKLTRSPGVIITQKGHLPYPWDNSSNEGSVFCRFGLLPLSMSNLHKSKSSSRASSHQLVSVTFGIWCSLLLIYVLTSTTYFVHYLFHFGVMFSVAFPVFLSLKTPGKFVCMCVFECNVRATGTFIVWVFWQ